MGLALDTVEDVLEEAARSAAAIHNHPEGIKGAQANPLAVFLARSGADRTSTKPAFVERFGYDLGRSIDAIRPKKRNLIAVAALSGLVVLHPKVETR